MVQPRKKILIVDDSAAIIAWVSAALAEEFDVVGHSSSLTVAAAVLREAPDLVILDVQMPLVQGDAAIAKIRHGVGNAELPVVFFSGLAATELARLTKASGATGFIRKSGDTHEFVARVRRFVAEEASAAQPIPDQPRQDAAKSVVVAGHNWIETNTLLLRRDFHVFELPNGRAVLDAISHKGGDLILVGPDLPDITAVSLCQTIRGKPHLCNISILHICDARNEPQARSLRRAGANEVLVRPFSEQRLFATAGKLTQVEARRRARLLVRLEVNVAAGEQFQVGFSHNLSSSGMLLELSTALVVGTTLKLRFFLPERSQEVATHGKVIRLAAASAGPVLAGLQFSDMTAADVDAIETFVQQQASSSR